jgi:hypothetical protein
MPGLEAGRDSGVAQGSENYEEISTLRGQRRIGSDAHLWWICLWGSRAEPSSTEHPQHMSTPKEFKTNTRVYYSKSNFRAWTWVPNWSTPQKVSWIHKFPGKLELPGKLEMQNKLHSTPTCWASINRSSSACTEFRASIRLYLSSFSKPLWIQNLPRKLEHTIKSRQNKPN